MVFVDGISLMPNNVNKTQKIPQKTPVKVNKVSSAPGTPLDQIK